MFQPSTLSHLDIKEEFIENEDLENYLHWSPFDDCIKAEDVEMEFDKIEGEMNRLIQTEESERGFGVHEQEQKVVVVKTEEVDIKTEEDEHERILKDWAKEMEYLMQQKPPGEHKTTSSGTDDFTTKTASEKHGVKQRRTRCIYCKKQVTNFQRHLVRKHSEKKEVQEFVQDPKKSRKRKKKISLLRNQEHFQEYLRGHIIPSYERPGCEVRDYIPCAYCKGIFSKKYLSRHCRKCEWNEEKPSKHLTASQTLMACSSDLGHAISSMRVTKEVFPIMKADDISLTAKTDPLIVHLGEHYLKGRNKSPTTLTCCSNKMRELSRLLIAFRQRNGDDFAVSDILNPALFNRVLDSVKVLGGYDETGKVYMYPSVAVHLRASLKQTCLICVALLAGKSELLKCASRKAKIKEVTIFQSLVESQWTTDACNIAFSDPAKVTLLSLTRQVAKFKEHALRLAAECKTSLRSNVYDATSYKKLVRCTLALTSLFNKEQVEDVQFLRISEYLDPSNADHSCQSRLDQTLTRRYKRVKFRRKDAEKATLVLFPPVVEDCINTILDVRRCTEPVPIMHDYLFSLSSTNENGTHCDIAIRQVARGCGVCEETMTSERLRKLIATVMQLLVLTENETKELLSVLGCSEQVPFVPSEDLQKTAKILRILNMTGKGECPSPIPDMDVDPDTECVVSDSDEECTRKGIIPESASLESASEGLSTGKRNKLRNKLRRSWWSEDEKNAVLDHFAGHIRGKVPPKKNETILFKLNHPQLFHDKDWVKIKAFVYNQYRMK